MTIKLITHNVFKKESMTMLNVVNAGLETNGRIRYLTKNGWQNLTKQEIENYCTKVIDIKDVDFKDSLYYWFRSNPTAYNKPIVISEKIDNCEVYRGNLWTFALQIKHTEDTIFINPLFDIN